MSAKNSEKRSRSQSRSVQNSNYNFSESRGTDPSLMKRSRFARNSTLATGFQVGDIVPLYIEEILPNDTVDMNCNFALRMQTLAVVPYDNLEFDIYWFYCPNRLLWDGWKAFCGETASAWLDKTPVRVPMLEMSGFALRDDGLNTVWDYFGLPLATADELTTNTMPPDTKHIFVNALPFRMYGKIYNDWFRDVNYDNEVLVDFGNNDSTYDENDPVKGGKPLKANKKHDYFSSVLPQPQRSDDISLLDGLKNLQLHITTADRPGSSGNVPISWTTLDGSKIGAAGKSYYAGYTISNSPSGDTVEGPKINDVELPSNNYKAVTPNNLALNFSEDAALENREFMAAFSIANLRKSIAKQQIAEVSARCGNRYQNFLLGFFGVDGPDIETGRSELLGIQHTTMRIAEVVQTSGSAEGGTPQGNIAGRSLTNIEKPHAFTKSFLEHGWIMALGVARYNHSYSQGIRRQWTRKILDDYYMPQYANIGDVPVYKYEIYADANTLGVTNRLEEQDYPIWGYQEYGAEYKYAPNQITGAIRPNVLGGLSPWTWGDNYEETPTMSPEWLKEDPENVSRSLAIEPTAKVPQIFGNFFFGNNHTRMMPIHSIPGLERV